MSLLTINPEDGDERVRLAKLIARRGDRQEASRQLTMALQFAESKALRREAEALLLEWTGERFIEQETLINGEMENSAEEEAEEKDRKQPKA